ncbi:GAF domain-containing protein [Reichenbachiella agariperforans]|uniref:GAF domain-containing protein n=1 Tax=Reichenbachiella agariperforans TaxID=156994 RepID=UPI001C0958D0|nr:GAF domain-containing protein [Reichenbachiella agariperforans]MBU2915480.1 GAF domain-containing protein [Reichenbachiella agariperforans]
MAEELTLDKTLSKQDIYTTLLPQIEALNSGETDLIANLANTSAALKEAFDFLWVGFYLVKEDQLVLGPFQGPIACTRISKGKGVCGTAWHEGLTLVVDNVDEFPGHIACSSASKSEIVVPLFKAGEIIGVLDIDSDQFASFDEIDQQYLEQLVSQLCKNL